MKGAAGGAAVVLASAPPPAVRERGLGARPVADQREVDRDRRMSTASRRLPVLVWLIAAAMAVLLLAVASAYGFHRDELYFILAGRHPDFGYVDQPPLTPLLSAALAGLLGVTPLAVRLVPALTAAAAVVLTADIARRLGASRAGQVLAALVLAISGWLGAGHLDETTTYDVLFWTLALWLSVPLLERDGTADIDRRRWLALGLVLGVALENKTLAAALPLTVGVSLVLLRRWDVFGSRWPWLAAVLAAAIWAPNVLWQAGHGFTQVQMAQSIAADQGGWAAASRPWWNCSPWRGRSSSPWAAQASSGSSVLRTAGPGDPLALRCSWGSASCCSSAARATTQRASCRCRSPPARSP